MKVCFVSLGCDKNLVDSEVMLGLLAKRGHVITDDETQAEAVIINTCTFIGDAKEESINTIIEMGELKKAGKLRTIIVTGCLAQRYSEEIFEQLPEVDVVVGTTAIDRIADALEASEGKKGMRFLESIHAGPFRHEAKRLLTTGGHYAYLKIAEGCDKHCTYCIIPKVRGDFRSVPMEELVAEARELAAAGVKELILVAQETTVYGTDLYGKKALPELLRRLCGIPELRWIRLLYCYPEEIDDELIRVISQESKIVKYLDIPIQHGCDDILRRMGRRTGRKELESIVRRLRDSIDGITLRTTLISGFPGETEQQHEELIDFVKAMKFDRLGVFEYSPEEDTPAAMMPDQVDDKTKTRRRDELMAVQQEIAFDRAEEKVGLVLEVMIEGYLPEEDIYVGRTEADAPEVDGCIFVESDRELMSGDFVRVQVTAASEYDLIGELCDESSE